MRKRIWQWAGLLTALLMLALAWALPTPAQAADTSYAGNHLSDYGIPDAVTEVLMTNSRYANGESPVGRGQTPATFTIGDVEQLLTVSLADVTYKGDGTIDTSTPDPTVAAWIASAKAAGSGAAADVPTYDIAQNAYSLNSAGQVETVLANKAMSVDGRNNEQPAVNFLFQIVASASSAAIVDLDGVTSQVGDTITAQAIMALFQTDRLPNLETLIISNDNLGDLQYIMYTLQGHPSLFNVTSAQHVTSLDMSNNGITSFPSGAAFTIGAHLTDLNFNGNPTTQISGSLNETLIQLIVRNGGVGKLDSLKPNTDDYNTVHWLVTLMNAASGTMQISSGAVNVIMQAVPDLVSDDAVNQYWPQMNQATAQAIINAVNQAKDPTTGKTTAIKHENVTLDILDLVASGEASTSINSLTVSPTLTIQPITLASPSGTYPSTTAFTVQADLDANATISVYMREWVDTDQTITPTPYFMGGLTFPAVTIRNRATSALTNALTLAQNAQIFYQNGSQAQKGLTADFKPGAISLALSPDELTHVRPGTYQASITWTVQDAQTTNSDTTRK
ncbi:hypothetical protein ACFQ3L_10220 [Lacticaseibacillus jixianensis]|uniref:Leucine-rich repeat domain-containing protein n=1 Tax=Lacticaseibacillus jixianensis TaxID=2486012 RepID=A0ABW4BAW1_9LACO|nr:leucine-rich repeat domain-containing protein [Lacticaseibacillus jixianensis]